MSFTPSPLQTLVLLRLLFTGQEPKQSDVKQLKPQARKEMIQAGFLELEKRGRAYHLLLTDKAWAWISDNLDSQIPANARTVDTLQALLARLKEYLDTPISALNMIQGSSLIHLDQQAKGCSTPEPPARGKPPETPQSPLLRPGPGPSEARTTRRSAQSPPRNLDKLLLGVCPKASSWSEVHINVDQLVKHIAILAGSGSGKTVLVRRLVEEAALLGIPSLVIDAANDLSRLGEPWPAAPSGWLSSDQSKAALLGQSAEMIIWTPGLEKGNPLHLSPLPDFQTVLNDQDELEQAVSMAREMFRDMVAPGTSQSAHRKQGILSAALHWFAHTPEQNLENFIDLLADLPQEAWGGISDAPKLGQQMADSIRAAVQTNPLLRHQGTPLDPALLFGPQQGPTKVSIIGIIFGVESVCG
ncbi:MAG: DUF87 domain-containing protein [Desulfovermiculus sp.]|nr:DUF87 domain-containing protein [Desulfovermiculus sp.]